VERFNFVLPPGDGKDLMAAGDQLPCHALSDSAGGARYENPH
jgi:hypothetical protein